MEDLTVDQVIGVIKRVSSLNRPSYENKPIVSISSLKILHNLHKSFWSGRD